MSCVYDLHAYSMCKYVYCFLWICKCVDGLIYHEVCLISIYISFFVTDPANAEIMIKNEGIPLITACLSSPSEKIVSYLLDLLMSNMIC